MNLSIETFRLRSRYGDKKAIEMIKTAGFDSIDYSFYWYTDKEENDVLGDNYLEYAKDLRSYLDKIGISCNQAHAPFAIHTTDEFNTTNEKYLKLTRAIESASILGAKNIIVHSIGEDDDFDINLKYFHSLEPFAKKSGIQISVENLFCGAVSKILPDTGHICFKGLFGTPEKINLLLDGLSPDTFTLCIDIGHAAITGNQPDKFIKNVHTDRLKALHVQDTDYTDDSHLIPYKGLLDWDKITEALSEVKYNGDLTLEVFGYLEGFDDEAMPDALKQAEITGRKLIEKIKSFK